MADLLVPRDPRQPKRTRDFLDKVALILNGLLRSGGIAVGGGAVYGINLAVGQTVSNGRSDGSVLYIDTNGKLAISTNATFNFDETGVGGEPTLYVGTDSSGVGVLALANGGSFTTFVPAGDGSGLTINADLTVSSLIATVGQFSTIVDLYNGGGSDDTALYIRANTAQATDLFRVSSQGGTIYSRLNKDGYFMTRKTAAPADADLATSEASWWWDDTSGAPRVSFKGKDSGGTVNSFSIGNRTMGKQGADVASANDTTLSQGNYFDITGNTTINGIASAGWTAGSVVVLQFDSTPTVKHNTAASAGFASLLLAGAVDFVASANDTLTLVYDGTTWRETGRAVI